MSSFAGAEDLLRHLTGELDNFEQIAQYLLPQPGDLPRLQGVDVVNDPELHKVAVNALAAQPRDVRCRQTDRLTDGTAKPSPRSWGSSASRRRRPAPAARGLHFILT